MFGRPRPLFFPLDDHSLASILVSRDPGSQRVTFLLQFIDALHAHRLKSSRNMAPDLLDTAIVNSTNRISPKIPAQNSAQHKYAHDNRARNGNGICRPARGHRRPLRNR